ncbi:hypothetical protein [Sphingomonas sp. MMS24-J13]|uniref:hypothetical protein n=1 Tax=Sphingomonas sp. MMS24-J13 TaxID=3238686 RepID=UPI00384E0EA0
MVLGLFIALAIAAAGGTVIAYLLVDRHRARYKLDTYGRPSGIKPAKSFVCPDCLHRSYAEQHIRERFCLKCGKSFPEHEKDREKA